MWHHWIWLLNSSRCELQQLRSLIHPYTVIHFPTVSYCTLHSALFATIAQYIGTLNYSGFKVPNNCKQKNQTEFYCSEWIVLIVTTELHSVRVKLYGVGGRVCVRGQFQKQWGHCTVTSTPIKLLIHGFYPHFLFAIKDQNLYLEEFPELNNYFFTAIVCYRYLLNIGFS